MFRRTRWTAAVAIGLMVAARPLRAADLATAKALYASASYEEALAELRSIGPGVNADDVQQYQALCYIALGRTSDAEAAIEALITRNPLFSASQRDVSPRFVSIFDSVRARLIPTLSRSLYAQAKRSFDQGRYAEAESRFTTLMALVKSAPAPNDELEGLLQLAEGFQKLAQTSLREQQAAAAPPSPGPAAAVQPAAQATASPATPSPVPASAAVASVTVPSIFSRDNADVRPPEAISRPIPSAPKSLGSKSLSGILTLVINERGTVETASLATSLSPLYDDNLLAAVRRWKFRPATKDGVAVSYRMTFPVVIADGGR